MRWSPILAAVAALASATPSGALDQAEIIATCGKFSELAGAIMKGRQNGVLMTKALEMAGPSVGPKIMDIIEGAYSKPRYSSEEYRAAAVIDYSNEVMSECLRSMR